MEALKEIKGLEDIKALVEAAYLRGRRDEMKSGELKLYNVDFKGIYPVGSCLVVTAFSKEQAEEIAGNTIFHTGEFKVEEIEVLGPGVITYLDGDY